MSSTVYSRERFLLEVADAAANDECVAEHFRQLTRARGWNGGKDAE